MRKVLLGVAMGAVLAGCADPQADPHVTVSPEHPDAVCAPAGPRPSNGLNCYLGEPGANPHRGQTNLGNDAIGIALIQPDTPTVACPGDYAPDTTCIHNPSGIPVRAVVTTATTRPPTQMSPLCPPTYVPGYRCYFDDGRLVVAVVPS
ncbi:MAG: hypothetical protein Q8K72_19005 [Acidimicrobiales bacterium]|nr:hypothetical protein [Acidimicrobiales bacterium]